MLRPLKPFAPPRGQLVQAGDNGSARKILEFVFTREIDEHRLDAANFLALAEVRLDSGDAPGAVELLRRLALVIGNPYENLNSAAALLEKTGHNAEAVGVSGSAREIGSVGPILRRAPGEGANRRVAGCRQIAGNAREHRLKR